MRRRDALRAGAAALAGTSLTGRVSAADDEYAPLGRLALDGATELVVADDGSVAYVACTDGYATVDLSDPANPTVLAERRDILADREGGPLREVHDVAVDGDTLLAVGPANYDPAAVNGALVVDVSDPANPTRVAFHETEFPIHNSVLHDGHAYLTDNGEEIALVVLDVDAGDIVSRWSLTDVDPTWRQVPHGLRVVHDVYVRDGLAYLAQWDAGTWLLDVSDPESPRPVGQFGEYTVEELADLDDAAANQMVFTPPGNSHYAAPNEDGTLLAVGRESWARRPAEDEPPAGGPSGIDLYDIADPTDPEHLSTIAPERVPDETYGGTWTTAHNFEFRGDVLYTSWYQGGVKRFDVSDPESPERLTWWRDADEGRFWTAQAGVEGEFFVASSMGVRGAGEAGAAGVWTFPDADGVGGQPLPSAGTPSPTASPSPTPSPSPTASPSPTPSPTATETDGPGFGPLAGVLGVAGVASRLLHRGDGAGDTDADE